MVCHQLDIFLVKDPTNGWTMDALLLSSSQNYCNALPSDSKKDGAQTTRCAIPHWFVCSFFLSTAFVSIKEFRGIQTKLKRTNQELQATKKQLTIRTEEVMSRQSTLDSAEHFGIDGQTYRSYDQMQPNRVKGPWFGYNNWENTQYNTQHLSCSYVNIIRNSYANGEWLRPQDQVTCRWRTHTTASTPTASDCGRRPQDQVMHCTVGVHTPSPYFVNINMFAESKHANGEWLRPQAARPIDSSYRLLDMYRFICLYRMLVLLVLVKIDYMFDHLSWNEQLIQKDSEIMKRMQVGSWVAHSQWAIHLFLSQACIESLLSSITRATTSGAKVWLFVWNQVGEWTLLMTMVQDDSCLFRSGCCPSDIRWESRNIPCYQGEGHTEQQWDDMRGEGHIEWQWDHMLGVHQGCVLPIHFVTMITWIWCLLCVSLFCYIAPVCFGCDFRRKKTSIWPRIVFDIGGCLMHHLDGILH